jgi:acyl carrier protein
MKNILKQRLIKDILKVFKINDEKKLIKIKRKNFDKWDSLAHLQIIFLIEKNSKKKISINKLNKISSGKDLVKILNENFR